MSDLQISAGAALAKRISSDPAARAGWERARVLLQAFGTAAAVIGPIFNAERERCIREFADAMREAMRETDREYVAAGFEPPRTIEDLEHLARIIEMPFETIKAGNFTAADVHAMALAWADRQRLKARIASAEPGALTTVVAPATGESVRGAEAPRIRLTAGEVELLRALAKQPARRQLPEHINAAKPAPADPKAVRQALRSLHTRGLVDYPPKSRRGVSITDAGIAALGRA